MKVSRTRPTRTRVCACGRVDLIRKDNPGVMCIPCAARLGGKNSRNNYVRHSIPCSGCGSTVLRSLSGQGKNETFCSEECRTKSRNHERICKHCGGTFTVYRSVVVGPTNATGNFCSHECYHKWMLAGADQKPHYIQMKGARRDAVVKGRVCARCGTPEKLEVHHVIPRRVGGSDEPKNLIPLCKGCHKIVECFTSDLITRSIPIPELSGRVENFLA